MPLDQLRSAICRLQSFTISEASTPEIPDHIIFTILSKLPVNTLLRFCTLSKNFREIITSSIFVNQHMRLVRESTSPCSVICPLRSHLFVCRMSSNGYVRKFELPVKTSFHRESDFDPVFFAAAEYHACNGLLCLAEVIFGVHPVFLSLIWNPATGKHRKVIWPQMSEILPIVLFYTYMGFGYEPRTDDYKIVLLSIGNSGKWIAQVMSLKGDKWRIVDLSTSPCMFDDLICHIGRQMSSVAVNGFVYWIACHCSTGCCVLLKFNLADESFSFVPMPEGTQAVDSRKQRKLATLGGLLYLFVWENDLLFTGPDPWDPRPRGVKDKIDIWKLQGSTWCQVGTIPTNRRLYPLGFNLSGHVIMVDWVEKSLVVYIPQNNRFLELNVNKVSEEIVNFHFVQMETLVSP